jgi:hypothetical protein
MPTPKDPVNYLLKDVPDYVPIVKAYVHLYKRQPSMKETREIQTLWAQHRQQTTAVNQA